MVEVSVAYQSIAFPVALKSATVAVSISQKVWFVSVVVGGSSVIMETVTTNLKILSQPEVALVCVAQ